MKYLVIALMFLPLFACKKEQEKPSFVCTAAKYATFIAAEEISKKWECDTFKIQAFLAEPLNGNVCPKQAKALNPVATIACPIIVKSLKGLTLLNITQNFGCNADKVMADLNNLDNLCSLINF